MPNPLPWFLRKHRAFPNITPICTFEREHTCHCGKTDPMCKPKTKMNSDLKRAAKHWIKY